MQHPFSVVIPAHDEGPVIARCLASLEVDLAAGAEVVVVCNGCTDDTADRARRAAPEAKVVELAVASKSEALNAGDEVTTAYPRFYLDADVELTPGALGTVAAELDRTGRLAGAPRIELVAPGASWPVLAYLDVWRHHPYFQDALIGAGVYGLSEAGRARFGRFPPVANDDLFVARRFAPGERISVQTCSFRPAMPRGLRDLVRVEVRHYAASAELEAAGLAGANEAEGFGWAAPLARDPRRWPALVIYAVVKLTARAVGRRQHRRGAFRWVKDESSRRPDPAAGAGR